MPLRATSVHPSRKEVTKIIILKFLGIENSKEILKDNEKK
jgi:hypothetical protein